MNNDERVDEKAERVGRREDKGQGRGWLVTCCEQGKLNDRGEAGEDEWNRYLKFRLDGKSSQKYIQFTYTHLFDKFIVSQLNLAQTLK